MPRYYFDLRDDGGLYPDDEGVGLPSIDAARQEAAHSLADMLRDAVRDRTRRAVRQTSVEVRNDVGPFSS
jgi:hypothetical protein